MDSSPPSSKKLNEFFRIATPDSEHTDSLLHFKIHDGSHQNLLPSRRRLRNDNAARSRLSGRWRCRGYACRGVRTRRGSTGYGARNCSRSVCGRWRHAHISQSKSRVLKDLASVAQRLPHKTWHDVRRLIRGRTQQQTGFGGSNLACVRWRTLRHHLVREQRGDW
jgi:hypothetical protein